MSRLTDEQVQVAIHMAELMGFKVKVEVTADLAREVQMWRALVARMERAAKELDDLANLQSFAAEWTRLSGKADGVRLAISYAQELERML